MAITQLLTKLLQFGISEGYFIKDTIDNLDKSCCNSSVDVIDFDKTEEFHRKKHNSQTLKSCDALKILPDKGTIDFIEMKGFRQFIRWHFNPNMPIDEQVKDKVEKWEYEVKLGDSIFILKNIINSNEFNITGTERKQLSYYVPKNIIFLTDIDLENDPMADFAITLSFLSQPSSSPEEKIAKALKDEFQDLPHINAYSFQKPKLMYCQSFDAFYQSKN